MAAIKPSLAIITTILDEWGGSEELWARTVPFLQSYGYDITLYKKNINTSHPEFSKLKKRGVLLQNLDIPKFSFVQRLKIRALNKLKSPVTIIPKDINSYLAYLFRQKKPALVLISQGTNFEGLGFGYVCSAMNIPFVLISQKATEFFWPYYPERKSMRKVYQKAVKCYFISKQNKNLTEEQFGVRFANAEIVFNPVRISRSIIPFPDTGRGYRLACIGRYLIIDKGQDILIRIMAMPKWKARPVTISFIGSGGDKEGLAEMSQLLKVENIEFLDQVNDIAKLWENYHALVLPSRSEGTPLVLLEAMACGRTAIVSITGGNPDLITDGITGFLGHPNEESFDGAMERAWSERENWQGLGNNAFHYLNENIPACPEEVFAGSIKQILNA